MYGMFRPRLYFLTTNFFLCMLVSTLFYLGGVFGGFFAKINVFLSRVLVHSIKFSFHSISGWKWYKWYQKVVQIEENHPWNKSMKKKTWYCILSSQLSTTQFKTIQVCKYIKNSSSITMPIDSSISHRLYQYPWCYW